MQDGDRGLIRSHLSQFKIMGKVNYDLTLCIPQAARIKELAKTPEGRMEAETALTASLKSAMSNINLKYPLNADQLIDIAEQIVDESIEDNLALEDVLLFLGQFITGKMGKIYDRMDVPKFFESFEVYRQERHEVYLRIKEERDSQYKTAGPRERSSEDTAADKAKHKESSAIGDYLKQFYK
jgi:uncharacterized protein YciU (UPF0263 family)